MVVAGTGTEVGKTWVGAAVLRAARAGGHRVAARKPAQSFDAADTSTDADVLGGASGEPPEVVCPPHRHYELPMAPFMAAARLGRPPFVLDDLLHELRWPPATELGLLEGAGGLRSPITADGGDTLDLARAIGADAVVLVADAGLGTINSVRLAAAALHGLPTVLYLNRYVDDDPLHHDNRDWLERHLGLPLHVEPVALLGHLLGGVSG